MLGLSKCHSGHSCLLLGRGEEGRPIHVVCSAKDEFLAIITAYVPLSTNGTKTSKRGSHYEMHSLSRRNGSKCCSISCGPQGIAEGFNRRRLEADCKGSTTVIPEASGIQFQRTTDWMPAAAGMTTCFTFVAQKPAHVRFAHISRKMGPREKWGRVYISNENLTGLSWDQVGPAQRIDSGK